MRRIFNRFARPSMRTNQLENVERIFKKFGLLILWSSIQCVRVLGFNFWKILVSLREDLHALLSASGATVAND